MIFDLICDKQFIVYGAPGTGKSYGITQSLMQKNIDVENDTIRLVFFRDYSYSDFLGFLSPINDTNLGLTYEFNPGPLTIAIEKAFLTEDYVCLVIEELNRGNCASIFGDVFQLLDRNKIGESSYSISNYEVRQYLNRNPKICSALLTKDIGEDDIILPSNLIIIGTMNTADQNVFTIDSAFKRRFKMIYMPIIFDLSNERLKRINELSKVNVFDFKLSWSDFAQKINEIIDSVNSDFLSISEDKKLGSYFVDEIDVSSKQTFCDKVLYYLKNDVFKYNDKYFTNSYEQIYKSFVLEDNSIWDIVKKEN